MKFKAGDNVKCVEHSIEDTTYGNVYTVLSVSECNGKLYFEYIDDVGDPAERLQSRFELVEFKPKFKIGDKVRCVSQSAAKGVEVGGIYTVTNPQLFKSQQYEGVYCMSLSEVISTPYDKHFELVQEDVVLTPEEVFEHLRKGTKLQWRYKGKDHWHDCIHSGNVQVRCILDSEWRIKPEPEVIELNGKKYREITD